MPEAGRLAWGWIALASLLGLAWMALDKQASRGGRGRGRIPERALLLVALVGGSPGIALGVVAWRHKSRKLGFLAPLALVIALQAAVAAWALTG